MKEIVNKLRAIEREIAVEKGPFLFFALFLREDAPDLWDLMVAAPWITGDKPSALKYIAEKVKTGLEVDELLKISRIVLIEEKNQALEALQQAIHVEHGAAEIEDSNFWGLPIKHAYLITSRREATPGPINSLQPNPL